MCDDGEMCGGTVRKLGKEELDALKKRWESGTSIEPEADGTYRIPMRFVIRPEDWRGFTGTTIKRVDSDE